MGYKVFITWREKLEGLINRDENNKASSREDVNRIIAITMMELTSCDFFFKNSDKYINNNFTLRHYIGIAVEILSRYIEIPWSCARCKSSVTLTFNSYFEILNALLSWFLWDENVRGQLTLAQWEELADKRMELFFDYKCKICGCSQAINFCNGNWMDYEDEYLMSDPLFKRC